MFSGTTAVVVLM